MSPPKASSTSAEDEQELDRIADELYALPTDEFVGARDDRIADAKAQRRQQLARELGRLRRPTQSAWLVNLLWRHERAALEELLDLGDALSRAQTGGSAADLRRLASRRGELESTLVARARALGERANVSVTAAMEREVEDTLAAALADPDVAAELRTGRLVKPAVYAGFGPFMAMAAPAAPPRHEDTAEPSGRRRGRPAAHEPPSEQPPAREPRETSQSAPPPGADHAESRAAERARQRRTAVEERVRDARVALEKVSADIADRARKAEAAEERQQSARARIESLRDELGDAEKDARAAEGAASSADRDRRQAERARDVAARTLLQAEAALDQLPS